jgi:hypothetical protein
MVNVGIGDTSPVAPLTTLTIGRGTFAGNTALTFQQTG